MQAARTPPADSEAALRKSLRAYLDSPEGKARALFGRFLKRPICTESMPWACEYSRALGGLRDETDIYCVSCKTRVWKSMQRQYKIRCCNSEKCLDDLIDNGEPALYPFSNTETRGEEWTYVLSQWRIEVGTFES